MIIVLLLALAAAPQQADAKVREALGTLEKALASKDDSVGDQFDLQRLLKVMERSGSIPDGTGDGFQSRGVRRLEENLSTVVSAAGTLNGGWERIEPLSVRLNATGLEAEALCRVTIGGKKGRFRFWLCRAGDSWKPYDYENLDGSYRLAVIGMQYAPGVWDDEEKNTLRDSVATLQRAQVYLSKGQLTGARDALGMARRSDPPAYVRDWVDLVDGLALHAMGNAAGALKAADRALVRQKDLAIAHRLKAACHVSLGESVKAIEAAKEYLRLVGDDPEGWTLVGAALEKMDQPEKALDAYRKAVDSDPEDAAARWKLARALRRQRRFDDAHAEIRKALEKNGEDLRLQDERGRLLAAQGELEAALAVAEELIRSKPKAEEFGMDLRVSVLVLAGKRDEALQVLRALLEKHPEWAPSAASGDDLEEFRKLPLVQEALIKARAKPQK